ncbi:acetate/propionate family kinase [Winogradskyella vincentii]|uniref:Acetate kinase n=1 Tax=Winogradskyella vincentii TaxID=2877122 RepID=A0ABS7Y1Y6_9FLAO|nr:acetate kinase [Winogradskyella vincentii]MCA0153949.1 acetate kinase [Winogradskyella vincentii]
MKVLVLNSGSSSVKYQLFSMPDEMVLCSGVVDRIGQLDSSIKHRSSKHNLNKKIEISDHKNALDLIVNLLLDENNGAIASIDEIEAVGHRVVHGGSSFKETIEIDSIVKSRIEELFILAPLHNPANLEGINVAESVFVNAKQAAVFDTAFHQTIPEHAYKYAIPNEFLEDHNIRLYGFHGTSHKYVSEKAIEYLGVKNSKIITIHLGNGCSISAVENGECKDHSLGFSPANGLIMGTRSGDIDHSIIFYLINSLKFDIDEVNKILQTKSGMLGLTGFSDLRDIEAEALKGNSECKLALDMSVYRIKKYIGSYVSAMNGLDCIVFTAGIGENSELMRGLVCADMDVFGIELDESANSSYSNGVSDISKKNSKVKILIIPTNEELEIARQTYNLFNQE